MPRSTSRASSRRRRRRPCTIPRIARGEIACLRGVEPRAGLAQARGLVHQRTHQCPDRDATRAAVMYSTRRSASAGSSGMMDRASSLLPSANHARVTSGRPATIHHPVAPALGERKGLVGASGSFGLVGIQPSIRTRSSKPTDKAIRTQRADHSPRVNVHSVPMSRRPCSRDTAQNGIEPLHTSEGQTNIARETIVGGGRDHGMKCA